MSRKSQDEKASDATRSKARRGDGGKDEGAVPSEERVERPNRTGGQAEGEPDVPEGGDTEAPLERKKPSQAEG